jgi:hypothetical protein
VNKKQILKLLLRLPGLPKQIQTKRSQAERLLQEAAELETWNNILRSTVVYHNEPVNVEATHDGYICYSPLEYNTRRAYAVRQERGGFTVNFYRNITPDSGFEGPKTRTKKAALEAMKHWVAYGKH